MRYPSDHKERTRERIVAEARRLFRRHGYEGVGLDALMASAGLTRGGFYRHFPSKAALFAEALGQEGDFVTRLKARPDGGRRALERGALEVVAGYLDPDHRQRVGRGCDLAALSADVARAGRRPRRGYTENVRQLVAELERHLAGVRSPDPRALATVALCVGGVTVARALEDEELAEALLGACRAAAERQLRS